MELSTIGISVASAVVGWLLRHYGFVGGTPLAPPAAPSSPPPAAVIAPAVGASIADLVRAELEAFATRVEARLGAPNANPPSK